MKKLTLREINRLSIEEYKQAPKVPVVVILDSIRSALNVGSVFRTGDAMAIERIILCGITATPPSKEITKTAIGATDSVDWSYCEDVLSAILACRTDGYEIVVVEQTDASIDLHDFIPSKKKIAIILGNEVKGVSQQAIDMADKALEIVQYGTKHSLNVSVCAGIVLYQITNFFRNK